MVSLIGCITMSYVVALTGGIASGKSTVAELFAQQGIEVIDADIIARQVVEIGSPALTAIEQHFGRDILLPEGQLNRPRLRDIIFSHPNEKTWLNNLLHPLIQQRTEQLIANSQSLWCLWVVPLLLENNLQHRANRVVVVDSEPQQQLARVLARDNVSQQQATAILEAQASRPQRLAIADDIIDNTVDDRSALIKRVEELTLRYNYLAQYQGEFKHDS